jgi:PST family polysaccharide transporter
LSSVALARLLSPESYGVADIAIKIAAVLSVLSPLAMSDVLVSARIRIGGEADASKVVAVSSVLTTTLLVLAASVVGNWYGSMAICLGLLAVKIVMEGMVALPLARLRKQFAFRRMTAVDGIAAITGLSGGVCVAAVSGGPEAIVTSPVLASVVRVIGLRLVRRSTETVRECPHTNQNRSSAESLWSDFMVVSCGHYVHILLVSIDVLVLAAFCSRKMVGYYTFAAMLALQTHTVLIGQFSAVLQPVLASLQESPERQRTAFVRVTRALSCIVVPVGIAQAVFAVPAVRLVFSDRWLPSVPIFIVMSLNMLMTFAAAPLIAILKANGRFRLFLSWQVLQLFGSLTGYLMLSTIFIRSEVPGLLGAHSELLVPIAISVVNLIAWVIAIPLIARAIDLESSVWSFYWTGGIFENLLRGVLVAAPFLGLYAASDRLLTPALSDVVVTVLVAPLYLVAALIACGRSNPDIGRQLRRYGCWLRTTMGFSRRSSSA